MTMLKRIEKLTEAEEAILLAHAAAPASASRDRAADILRERGLPTRRSEAWHYTDLRNNLRVFPGFAESLPEAVESVCEDGGLIGCARLAWSNGELVQRDALPAGITAEVEDAAGGFRDASDAVALLNSILASRGLAVSITGPMEAPVELLHRVSGSRSVSLRHRVDVAKGAGGTVIERHVSDGESISNLVVDLELGDGADLTWIYVQEEDAAATHLSQLNVRLGAQARLTILSLNCGGRLVRREIDIMSRGAESDISIRGVNLVGGDSHVDVTTVLLHDAPGVTASEIFRNVATARGSGVFQGQIRVAQEAQKTDARMACNTLLLSDEAEFFAKPELEIFADDVQCAHGATVTDILDDHLFYLMSRGIGPKQARSMLVQAFVQEVFDAVEDDTVREALDGRIENWLERNG